VLMWSTTIWTRPTKTWQTCTKTNKHVHHLKNLPTP